MTRWIGESQSIFFCFNKAPLLMNNAISINLTDSKGTPAEIAMQKIIQARTKELGETTENACVALVINILKSLRADSKLASLKSDISVEDVTGQYTPSFVREKGMKGKHISKRILRSGEDGAVVNSEKVVWVCGKYHRGEQLHTYKVTDNIAQDAKYEYLMVAEDPKKAEQHATKFHINKVKRTRGLAKYVLGLAMHKVHSKESIGANVTSEAQNVGMKNAEVNVHKQGFNSGSISISVHDKLDYAALALKSGDNGVQLAMQRALNSMTAYINKRLDEKGIHDKLAIPFEDMTKKGV